MMKQSKFSLEKPRISVMLPSFRGDAKLSNPESRSCSFRGVQGCRFARAPEMGRCLGRTLPRRAKMSRAAIAQALRKAGGRGAVDQFAGAAADKAPRRLQSVAWRIASRKDRTKFLRSMLASPAAASVRPAVQRGRDDSVDRSILCGKPQGRERGVGSEWSRGRATIGMEGQRLDAAQPKT